MISDSDIDIIVEAVKPLFDEIEQAFNQKLEAQQVEIDGLRLMVQDLMRGKLFEGPIPISATQLAQGQPAPQPVTTSKPSDMTPEQQKLLNEAQQRFGED